VIGLRSGLAGGSLGRRPIWLSHSHVAADLFAEAFLAALHPTEARELVVDAWRMVVPQKLSRAYDLAHPDGPG
jgi:hypothetical protein